MSVSASEKMNLSGMGKANKNLAAADRHRSSVWLWRELPRYSSSQIGQLIKLRQCPLETGQSRKQCPGQSNERRLVRIPK